MFANRDGLGHAQVSKNGRPDVEGSPKAWDVPTHFAHLNDAHLLRLLLLRLSCLSHVLFYL